MKSIYDLIVQRFENGMDIPLIEGGTDIYLGATKTYFRGKKRDLDAIQYEIGVNGEKKKVTKHFIELTYKQMDKDNFPDRSWYENNIDDLIRFEYETRPCNYSVTQGLIKVVLKK